MSERDGKFGVPDAEDMVRSAHLAKTVTPLLSFDTLVDRVKQARARGPVYDGVWSVLESLTMELAEQKKANAELKRQLDIVNQKLP